MTNSMDIFFTFPVNSSTASIESIDPTNAATTVSESGIELNIPFIAMVTMARNIFAPDEMPSTNGPAIGLRKKVWMRNPESESAPPKTAASKSLGSRIFQIIL